MTPSSDLQRSSDAVAERERFPRILAVSIASSIFIWWVRRFFLSLWIDEFAVALNYEQSLRAMLTHFLDKYPVSPLYYLSMWLPIRLFGDSEIVLRFPSLLCTAGAAFLFYRLVRHFFDDETALLSVLAFACHRLVTFAATNARPYGLALLLTVGSLSALIRWTESGQKRFWFLYIALTAALFYVQPLFGTIGLIHAGYFFLTKERAPTVAPNSFVSAWVAIGLLLLPFLSSIAFLWGRREQISIVSTLSFVGMIDDLFFFLPLLPLVFVLSFLCVISFRLWLKKGEPHAFAGWIVTTALLLYARGFSVLFLPFFILAYLSKKSSAALPSQFVIGLFLVLSMFFPLWLIHPSFFVDELNGLDSVTIFSAPYFPYFRLALIGAGIWILRRFTSVLKKEAMSPVQIVLALGWFLLPPLVLFLISSVSHAKVFFFRYYMPYVFGQALVVGWLLRQIKPAGWRHATAVALVVWSMVDLVARLPDFQREDWRTAVEKLSRFTKDPQTPVFLQSGFIELNDLPSLLGPAHQRMFRGPFLYYPLRARICLLPLDVSDPQKKGYILKLTEQIRRRPPTIVLVMAAGDDSLVRWMDKKTERFGYRQVFNERFGITQGVVYKRRSKPSGFLLTMRSPLSPTGTFSPKNS